MGKGDKKTKRGKIIIGSYGVSRLRSKKNGYVTTVESVKSLGEATPVIVVVPDDEKTAVAKKKPATKKTTLKEVVDNEAGSVSVEQKKTKKTTSKKVTSGDDIQN